MQTLTFKLNIKHLVNYNISSIVTMSHWNVQNILYRCMQLHTLLFYFNSNFNCETFNTMNQHFMYRHLYMLSYVLHFDVWR